MSNFRVGQKVVCVDDKNWRNANGNANPKKGEIYTIAGLGLFIDGVCGVILAELGKCGCDPYQPDFLASRFRPLVERKTDISIFTKMLDGTRVLESTVTKGYQPT